MRPGGQWKAGSWAEGIAVPRMRLGLILVGLAIVFFGVNFCEKVVTSYQANQQVMALEQQIATLDHQNDALQHQIAYYQTPAYVIAMARDNYFFDQPGDTVFRIAGDTALPVAQPPAAASATPPAAQASPPRLSWWQRLLRLFGQ
jgi:cell division protein FtsB